MPFLPEEIKPNGRNHFDLLRRCHVIKMGNTQALNSLPATVENATSLMYHIGYVFPGQAQGFLAELTDRGEVWAKELGLAPQMLRFWIKRVQDGVRDGIRDVGDGVLVEPAHPQPKSQESPRRS